MAGRMGGRGRGKPAISFSLEQLGFSKGEALPAPVLQPSANFPPLDHKPLPIELTSEMSYLVELKKYFVDYMRESPNYVQAVIPNEDIERYCEDYEESIAERDSLGNDSKHDWSRMPGELKSLQHKHKLQQQSRKRKHVDIEKKLMELEKKEKMQQTKAEEAEEEEDKEEEEEKDIEEEEPGMKEEEELDEEMDEGTDYVNDYFDTGENYFSEDDNDDGPTYTRT